MARWLAANGHDVSVLTWDEGQDDAAEFDRVRVFKTCPRNAGIPGLRFFWPRWSGLVCAMKRADADVYYQNCGEYVTGQVAWWCRRHDRKFVYSVASEPDCDSRLPGMRTIRERVLYRYGLRHADRIVVQTRRQSEMLRNGFGVSSVRISMPCAGPADHEVVAGRALPAAPSRVLWLGRLCQVKRPDRFLDVAELCPDLAFDLVGPPDDSAFARRVVSRANRMGNVTMWGPAERDRVSEFYCRASCLCCTSDFEGFPNTFLEAWSYGLPIVSTVDPDGLIAQYGLGANASDAQSLAVELRRLLQFPRQWRQASKRARNYYLKNHSVENVMPEFASLFLDVVKSRGTPRAKR